MDISVDIRAMQKLSQASIYSCPVWEGNDGTLREAENMNRLAEAAGYAQNNPLTTP